jgi:hypothetical protein
VRVIRDPTGVTLANWRDHPFNRWSFLHLGDLLEMAPILRARVRCGYLNEVSATCCLSSSGWVGGR